jgi:hypothetical protein
MAGLRAVGWAHAEETVPDGAGGERVKGRRTDTRTDGISLTGQKTEERTDTASCQAQGQLHWVGTFLQAPMGKRNACLQKG